MDKPAPSVPWIAIIAVVLVAFGGGVGLSWWQQHQQAVPAIDGLLWPDPPKVPAVELTDQNGAAFPLEQLRGHWTLLFFGFTHCPDVCPTALQVLAQAHGELARHPSYGDKGRVVFVSVDPDRDTPPVLAQYVGYFHPSFIGVTGPVDRLQALTSALGALFMKVAVSSTDYSVDHSAGIFFIDPELRLVDVITPPHSAQAVVARFDAVSRFIEAQR